MRPQKTQDLCGRCGEDLGISQFTPGDAALVQEKLCRPCELVPPAFDRAVAFGVYEGPLRKLIHVLKYDRVEPVAKGLAGTLVPQLLSLLAGHSDEVLVVPVPLHRSKRRVRGFNQAELLARAVRSLLQEQQPHLRLTLAPAMLERKRATESQTGLTTRQRRRNVRGVFFVAKKEAARIAGRTVLLVDDIYTTGATARACSQALKQAGAGRVWVATVGRAQREGVARWDAGAIVVTAKTGFVPVVVAL